MASYNKVIMVGNLVTDPELKTTPTGKHVIKLSLAVARAKTRNNPNPETDFFEIEAWGYTAEFIARWFTKGKPILVDGRLENQSWNDNGGNRKTKTVIKVDAATFVENKSSTPSFSAFNNEPAPTYSPPTEQDGFETLADDDELPF